MTFGTKQMAQSCAATIEGEIEQLKASGFLKPAGLIVGDLIDRYIGELYPLKRWSASKTRDIRVVKRKLGADLVSCPLDHSRIAQVFTDTHADGTREDVFAHVERVRQLFRRGSL
jgi:hypothetical protein